MPTKKKKNGKLPAQQRGTPGKGKVIARLDKIPEALRLARDVPGITERQQRVLGAVLHTRSAISETMDIPTKSLIEWLQMPTFEGGLSERLEEFTEALDILALGALSDLVTQHDNKRVRLRAVELVAAITGRVKEAKPCTTNTTMVSIEQVVGAAPGSTDAQPADTHIDVRALKEPTGYSS